MKRLITIAGAIIALLVLHDLPVYAADLEQVTENMVLETSTDTEMYESPSETSAVIAALAQGTTVITLSQSENGWCRVSEKDQTGYIRLDNLKSVGDKESLEQEFRQNADNDEMLMNELERIRSQKLQSGIWGTIIVVLVAAMFTAGILSARRKNKEEANQQEVQEGECTNETDNSDTLLQ